MTTFFIVLAAFEAVALALLSLWSVHLYGLVLDYRSREWDFMPLEPVDMDYYKDSNIGGFEE